MNVVVRYLHRVNINVMPIPNPQKQFSNPVLNISTEAPFSVFRGPHQMIFGVVNGMVRRVGIPTA